MKSLRILIFIVAYNAESTIQSVLSRIPKELSNYSTEVLIIDDASADSTWLKAEQFRRETDFPFTITVLANPINQGYGGNQKLGFLYAIENNFDIVALVHGDGQYAPEALPTLLAPIVEGRADAVFGSRMLTAFGALKGGMPLYKYVGNRILTAFQNFVLRTKFSEFHSGYRLYSVEALKKVPFSWNANVFHFDTEIIIQLLFAKQRILELPIPTYYGDEICRVNGMKYAWDVAVTTVIARMQSYCLLYKRNFDIENLTESNEFYKPKLGYDSPHTYAIDAVKAGSTVVDLGCAGGYMCAPLQSKNCKVIGVDQFPSREADSFDQFYQRDLNDESFVVDFKDVDTVLMLDVIEHLFHPEAFMSRLREQSAVSPNLKIVISTGNIAFLVQRLTLLLGQFNYGKRGILDLTHTRLFTFYSLRSLLESCGYTVISEKGVPAPFPMVVKNAGLANFALNLNKALIKISKSLFAYQIFVEAKPLPTLARILEDTKQHTKKLNVIKFAASEANS